MYFHGKCIQAECYQFWKLIWNNGHPESFVDADGLVFKHQGISSNNANRSLSNGHPVV